MKKYFEITVLSVLFFNLFAIADDKYINEYAKPGKQIPKFEIASSKTNDNVFQADNSECQKTEDQKKSQEAFDKLVKDASAKDEKIVLSRKNPDSRSVNSMTYRFDAQKLAPGESVYLWIPSDLAKKGTNFVVLGHRQNPSSTTGPKDGTTHDDTPGLTSVQVYDANRAEKDRWRHWGGMASGTFGAKFAERDQRYEMENLYQWSKLGHRGVKSGDFKHDAVFGSAVKLVNMGSDEVEISELTYKTNLEKGSEQVEKIFTDGTKFGDVSTQENYVIGGGQATDGTFPNAIQLGPKVKAQKNLPAGWKFEYGQLMIPLPKGKILTGVELSAGDAHPDKVNNSDGGFGTKGWARLNIETQHQGQTMDVLMKNENVPPEGILMAAPLKCGQSIQEGDYLVLKSNADTTYIGGVRLSFKDP
jgi:hypothetical protein